MNKTTLLDYPGHVATTLFLGGCNFRCHFCQNSSLVLNPAGEKEIQKEELFNHLNKRRGIITAVCITGGEPTLYPDLPDFIREIKSFNLKIKLDTNGYNPEMLSVLLDNNLLNMVSMDIKSSKEVYPKITGIDNINIDIIDKSINILKNGNICYEFRTTLVDEYFSKEVIHSIGKWLPNDCTYYLQKFRDSDSIITPGLHAPKNDVIYSYLDILKSYIPDTHIRGID